MRVAISEKDYKNKIMRDMPDEPVLNVSHVIVKSIFDYGAGGYVLKRACRYDRDKIDYSLPYYLAYVDVSSKEDPMFFGTSHSFGIQERLLNVLLEDKVPHLNIFDFKYGIQYWLDMDYFMTHKVALHRNNEEMNLSIKYFIIPFEDFDIVYDTYSIYPKYLLNEQNIDVSMIPKREFKYEGRADIDKV